MAQPEFVPLAPADRVRPADVLPPHQGWLPTRPGEITGFGQGVGRRRGHPGPDQGFGLTLAHRFTDRLELAEGEHAEDVVAGCLAVGLRRASVFHRAPVIHDMELAFTVWGHLGGAPEDLIAYRRPLFQGASHHYWDQRAIADRVREATLRLTPAEVRARLHDWSALLVG